MSRLERRLLRLLDRMTHLDEEIRLTGEELVVHRHLDDDARRDAAVGGPIEREDAAVTAGDVARLEALLVVLRSERVRLERRIAGLTARLE
ncbi:MAG: hypothetical protein QY307_01565 [Acidimicrobiia bacterium]|nr:MAG: hypothetical protein QY307_01565 [Acidimicrobiia bacterium]